MVSNSGKLLSISSPTQLGKDAPADGWRRPGASDGRFDGRSTSVASVDDATVATKPRYATAALFHGFPSTLIAEVLCCTRQTADHFKRGTRRPGATVLRLWMLYHNGRILGDEWDGWQARDGSLFDPEGHRTTQSMLRAYAFVWQLARDLARGDAAAMEALDQYASLGYERMKRERMRREAGAASATARPRWSEADASDPAAREGRR